MSGNQGEIAEKRIYLTSHHYITLTLLITIILWLIAATVLIINKVQINPLQNEKLNLHQELEKVHKENEALTSELSVIKNEFKSLFTESEIPILSGPLEGATVIGNQISFEWVYSHHNRYQKYFIEIRNLSDCDKGMQKFNVIKSEQRGMYFPLKKLCSGEHLWRITPGYLLGNQEVIQGQPSKYGIFTVYESVIERIQKEKIIRVGTSPSFSGKFNFLDNNNGAFQGLDLDLIKWIVKKIEKKLGLESGLEIKIMDVPWVELLPMLQNNELDVVISSMTSTAEREKKFSGIKFTNGYFQVQQIFIQSKNSGEFPNGLKDKIVGVTRNTTNEQVADYLSNQFGFVVDRSYQRDAGVYQALFQKEIDFALVDDVMAEERLKDGRVYKFGESLDTHLIEFYKKEFKRESEMYAIAVIDERPKEPNLLTLINQLLESKEGQDELNRLKEKWIYQ